MDANSQNGLVARQFDPRAKAYLSSAVHSMGPDLDELAARVGEHPDWAALDVGCGGGHVAFRLAPLVREVTAYDLSDPMLAMVAAEAAKRDYKNVLTKRGVAESLPFPDGSMDLVASRYSAHHWSDVPAALAEMRRVAKPGGAVAILDLIAPDPPLLDTWLQSMELLRDPSHVRNYSLREWKQMLAAAGFGVQLERTFRLRLEFASWIERMSTPQAHAVAIRSLQSQAGNEVLAGC
jgi:ubiquinone/menaquinone biosynthesis C-methylase UbiE